MQQARRTDVRHRMSGRTETHFWGVRAAESTVLDLCHAAQVPTWEADLRSPQPTSALRSRPPLSADSTPQALQGLHPGAVQQLALHPAHETAIKSVRSTIRGPDAVQDHSLASYFSTAATWNKTWNYTLTTDTIENSVHNKSNFNGLLH